MLFGLFANRTNRKGSGGVRSEPEERHKERNEGQSFLLQMKLLAAIGCALIFIYSLRFWATGQSPRILGVGMLVAGAALLSGLLLGFIFAIPRVGDQKGGPAARLSKAPRHRSPVHRMAWHRPTPTWSRFPTG